jgi:thiaminase
VSATRLLEQTRDELAEVDGAIRSHRFLDLLGAGGVPGERLAALAGEQRSIVSSDRRSFAHLAARFPEPPAGDFFLSMAEGEGEALRRLEAFAAFAGLDAAELAAHEPDPDAQAYPAFVAWLALNGSRSDVVLAFLANLAAWGENCGRVKCLLRPPARCLGGRCRRSLPHLLHFIPLQGASLSSITIRPLLMSLAMIVPLSNSG